MNERIIELSSDDLRKWLPLQSFPQYFFQAERTPCRLETPAGWALSDVDAVELLWRGGSGSDDEGRGRSIGRPGSGDVIGLEEDPLRPSQLEARARALQRQGDVGGRGDRRDNLVP